MHRGSEDPAEGNVSSIRLQNASFTDFTEKLCEVHSIWGFQRPDGASFDAEINNMPMGDLSCTDVRVGFGLSGERTKKHISQINDAFYGVILMLSGGQRIVQGSQEVELQAGEMSVWDASRPARFCSDGPVRQVSVLIPHKKLKLYSHNIENVCAQRINGRSGLGLLLASHLQALTEVLPHADSTTQAGASQATIELVSATMRPDTAQNFKSTLHQTMYRRIQEYVINNLRNPYMSPRSIADAFRITPRYLHKIFEGTGSTVSEWILNRRLEACRTSLLDPALKHMTITEIAFNWGFNNAAYFSRTYRQKYDATPTETKMRALKD